MNCYTPKTQGTSFQQVTTSLPEYFSIECRKIKTKVITMANQSKGKCHKEPIRTQSKYM